MCRCACVEGVWAHVCTYIWRPKDRLLLFRRSCQGSSVSTSPESERQMWLPLTWVRGTGLEPSGLNIRALLVGPSLQSLYPLFRVLIFKVFFFIYVYVYVGTCVPVSTGSRGGWKKASVPFELESWSVGSYPAWVIGAEHRSSEPSPSPGNTSIMALCLGVHVRCRSESTSEHALQATWAQIQVRDTAFWEPGSWAASLLHPSGSLKPTSNSMFLS